jgi:hypothetical protein
MNKFEVYKSLSLNGLLSSCLVTHLCLTRLLLFLRPCALYSYILSCLSCLFLVFVHVMSYLVFSCFMLFLSSSRYRFVLVLPSLVLVLHVSCLVLVGIGQDRNNGK